MMMKRGFFSLAALMLLILGGCNKTEEQIPPLKCNDFNNRQTVQVNFNDTASADMANYFEGSQCRFRWKIGAFDCCQNAPLEIWNKLTMAADDSISTVKIGYTFDRTGVENYMELKKSAPYYATVWGERKLVMDIYNPVNSFNRCTTCTGEDPTPVSNFIEVSFPSDTSIEANIAHLKKIVRGVNMRMNYIYNIN